jgi:hypothetical protein
MPLARGFPLLAQGNSLPTLLHSAQCDLRVSVFVPSVLSVSSVLNSLESADPQNVPVTLLESALPNFLDLKSFRIRTSKKKEGGAAILLHFATGQRIYFGKFMVQFLPLLRCSIAPALFQ